MQVQIAHTSALGSTAGIAAAIDARATAIAADPGPAQELIR